MGWNFKYCNAYIRRRSVMKINNIAHPLLVPILEQNYNASTHNFGKHMNDIGSFLLESPHKRSQFWKNVSSQINWTYFTIKPLFCMWGSLKLQFFEIRKRSCGQLFRSLVFFEKSSFFNVWYNVFYLILGSARYFFTKSAP